MDLATKQASTDRRLFSFLMLAGCSWSIFFALCYHGYEGTWYRLHDVMAFSANPPFQHRLLLVWLANAIKTVVPTLSDLACYWLSQILPVILAVYAIKKWAEFYIDKQWAFLAQLLLVAMLIPTFRYYTFYDVAIVFFYTICLLNLMKRRFGLYLVFFAIGTLNHEVMLLLIPLFVVIYFDSDLPWSRFLSLILLQLAVYAMVRAALFYFLPAPAAWQSGKLWLNLQLLLSLSRPVADVFLTLIFWYVLAMIGMKYAPRSLNRCVILLPLLMVMVVTVGQLNEARHFDPFIPIAIALILNLAKRFRITRSEGETQEQGLVIH